MGDYHRLFRVVRHARYVGVCPQGPVYCRLPTLVSAPLCTWYAHFFVVLTFRYFRGRFL